MAKKNCKKKVQNKFSYSALAKSVISHVKNADRIGAKAWSLSNRPQSKEYHDAWKKSVYHEKIAFWQLSNGEVASNQVKKTIWDSIE